MSVGDLYDIESTGEFAVAPTRIRRRHRAAPTRVGQPNTSESGGVPITVLTSDAALVGRDPRRRRQRPPGRYSDHAR